MSAEAITDDGLLMHVDNSQVLHVAGELDAATAAQFAAALDAVAEQGGSVHVDLSGVDFIGAAGANVLIEAAERLGREQIVLCGVGPSAQRVLEITGFNEAVEPIELASYRSSRRVRAGAATA